MRYPSVEHAYQAAKTTVPQERAKIARLATPGEAKRAGRRVTLRPDWDAIKLDVMRGLLLQKFTYPDLGRALLETKPAELIEGNSWHDTFWGVDLTTGRGENHLGKLLMEIRDAD